MKIIQLILTAIIVLVFITGYSKPKADYPSELNQLHANVLSYILKDQINVNDAEILLTDLKENGTWPGIDYNYKEDGPWKPRIHLSNLLDVVRGYRTPGNKYFSVAEVSQKIHAALNFWLEHNFQSPFSWWYNEIGIPESLAQILLLMEDELSEKEVNQGVVILNRAKIKYTGENKVWVSGIVLMKSMLLKNIDSIKIAGKSVQDELAVRMGDGIQPDWSFHQHGPLLQFGNYGLGYVGDMMKWIQILRKTSFAFGENKIEILRNYILQGLHWASWKKNFDISACGRQLLENSTSEKAKELSGYIEEMMKLDPVNAEEYGNALDYKHLEGHKHFWRSEYQVKRTPKYFFSVKMVSKRVKGAESSRFENVNGYYLGDGATFLYQKGDEYKNIFPFWDWKKIPGTTTQQDDKKLPLLLAKGYFTDNEFVGGISDGRNGIAVMDYKRDGLTAKKSWFMFGNVIVCLGAGISSSNGVPVTTSVNQSYFRGNAVVKTSEGMHTATDEEDLINANWILHDNIGYFFPEKSTLRLETKLVEGSWYRVATHYPDEKMTSKIFNLWFDHGKNPTNETYCYFLIPNASKEQMLKLERETPFKISNTLNIQEVETIDRKFAGAIFYKAGTSKVFGGITVNAACIVMLEKGKEGIRVSISDPAQKLKEVQLKIDGKFKCANSNAKEGQTIVNVSLPNGGDAGKTTTFSLPHDKYN